MANRTSRQRLTWRAMFVMLTICVVCFGACILALARIQIVKGDYYREKAAGNQLHDTVIAAERGVVYDTNMNPLAESTSVKKVYVNPSLIGDNVSVRETIVKNLSQILDVSEESVRQKCSMTSYKYMEVKTKVEYDVADKVSEFMKTYYTVKDEYGNEDKIYYNYYIGIDPDVKRYYSKPFFASCVLGFIGTENSGLAGLELEYNTNLTGVPGRIITAQNGGMNASSMPIEYKSVYDAEQGNSLVLTINEYIQNYLESALQQAYIDTQCETALGIVMETETGAILGMASRGKGYYDLSSPWTIADTEKAAEIDAIADTDERRAAREEAQYSQWKNICVSDTYEPGSVFKIITASALLEENLVPMDETFNCTGSVVAAGSKYNCHKHQGHGVQTIREAIKNSCNPFFITRGLRLGIDGFNKYFEAFGFLERSGIDLPSETNSIYYKIDDMILSNVASASFGQTFQITPIQMITACNAIGNGGKLMRPYVVKEILDTDGNVISETKPVVRRQVISEKTSETMRDLMEGVVKEGTGKNAYVAGYRVAGKTGTSEKVSQKNSTGISSTFWASFTCFAPADDPKVTMLVIIDSPVGPHGGGAIAAPVAGEVLSGVLEYLNVEPQYTGDELAALKITAPETVGMAVGEAQKAISALKLTYKVKGSGDTVLSQIPSAGQSVPKNGVVILYTSDEAKTETVAMPDLTKLTITQAVNKAAAAGINVNITGNSLLGSELVSYKQSIDSGKEVSYGTVVTVYFKSNMGIADLDE